MIPTLMGASSASPFGRVIGATDPTQDPTAKLSVKSYVVSGQTVWGSYQCAPCNDAIIKLKKRLNAFVGLLHRPPVNVDGLIGDATVALLQAVATYGMTNDAFIQGGLLRGFTTKQALAEKAHVASDLVRQIAELVGFDVDRTVVTNPTPKPPHTTTSSDPSPYPAPMPQNPITPYQPPDMTTSVSIFTKMPKWSWYVAGGVLFAGLVTASVIVWKE